ncbi:hypothetical protein MASR1M45_16400 [Candidatus Kapaibacterium sp.]
MKILHCSDIHLGRRIAGGVGEFSEMRFNDYFNAFDYIVEKAIDYEVDVFVVAGDFFDKREISPEVLHRTENILRKLSDNKIECLIIEGNHDNISYGREKDSWIYYLSQKQLVRRVSYSYNENSDIEFPYYQINNVRFYGLGYPGLFVEEVVKEFSEKIIYDNDFVNYLIIHTAITDGIMSGTIKAESIFKLKEKVHYIAGGHLHNFSKYPSEYPFFFVPGSPEMWDFSEFNQKKGFIIFDTDSKKYEFYPSKRRETILIESNNSINNINDLIEIVKTNDRIEYFDSKPIVYLKCANQNKLDNADIESFFLSKGACKVFIINNNNSNYAIFENASDDSNLFEVEKEVITSWNLFDVDSTFNMLQRLKRYHEEDLMDDFHSTLDEFLDKQLGV